MNRKAYFFLLDGIFSVVILIIGFIIISSHNPTDTFDVPLSEKADGVMTFLASSRLTDICDFEYGEPEDPEGMCLCTIEKLDELCDTGMIMQHDQKLLDYFGELAYREENDLAEELMQELVDKGIIDEGLYGFAFYIGDDKIYGDDSWQEAEELIASKRIMFGFYEDRVFGDVYFWGPYNAEVYVWQK